MPSPLPLAGCRVAVIGAGLAGCATAHALAQAGAEVHLVDRLDRPAGATSGNPAGLVHPVFHHPDTAHARLHRAAALDARHAVDAASADSGLPTGRGLLRLGDPATAEADRAALAASGLPSSFVQWLDVVQAQDCAGLPLARPGWWFPDGGWVSPAALCAHWLDRARASGRLRWAPDTTVDALAAADGHRWRLVASGRGAASTQDRPFDAVVVAAGGAASMDLLAPHADVAGWPLEPVRGQLLGVPAGTPGLRPPRVAVAGLGYALPATASIVWVGATAQAGDADTAIRASDRATLLAQARAFGVLPSGQSQDLHDRTGIRWRTDDRLPVIGPVPAAGDGVQRADQPRFVPRVPGLYLFSALGSRGIGWAHWGAQLLVSGLAGTACPVESSLLDRVDPARFRVRAWRRSGRGAGSSPA
jgi:tRNA 5-methylaminomethyl-2-thiouridine biosynthesis bifunctional protein